MTLAELNAKMKIGVARPDLTADNDDDYSAYLNDAQREICRLYSFNWMRTSTSVTILAGTSSIALPTNFKELTTDVSPVHEVDDSSGSEVYTPVAVWTPEKVKRWQRSTVLSGSVPAVYVDQTTSPQSLSIGTITATASREFQVSYFKFLDDLDSDSDTNKLTDDYPQMLLHKAKALAFGDINDEAMVEFHEGLFTVKFLQAKKHDSYARVAGQNLHM